MNIQLVIKLLKEKGLTQAAIAKSLAVSQPTISDLANGKHGQVRPSSKVVDGLRVLLKKYKLKEA